MNDVATIERSTEVTKQPTFGAELATKITAFSTALPKHIPQERFARVIMTAVQRNPDLLKADRQSLWNSAMQAAADGLLPDGREGALVIYKTKSGDRWIDKVQWMPMIAGLRKKVRNSAEIISWEAQVVHAKDVFEYELGDDPFIKHKPHMDGAPGPVIAAYSVATLKGGEKSREVMTRTQLDKVRSVSKSKDKGPWVDWYEEMCRKAVARRHSKVLPMSTDLDDLLRRDDELYDLKGASDRLTSSPRLSLAGKLDALAGAPTPEQKRLADASEPAAEDRATAVVDAADDVGQGGVDIGDDDGDRAKGEQPDTDTSKNLSPRETLIHDLRGKIMQGYSAPRLIDGLADDQRALLTDHDRRALKDAWKSFSGKSGDA